jgi:hypothetical protein
MSPTINALNRQTEIQSKRQLAEDFSVREFDFGRARTLAGQI